MRPTTVTELRVKSVPLLILEQLSCLKILRLTLGLASSIIFQPLMQGQDFPMAFMQSTMENMNQGVCRSRTYQGVLGNDRSRSLI